MVGDRLEEGITSGIVERQFGIDGLTRAHHQTGVVDVQ